jgi:hypothetical protein
MMTTIEWRVHTLLAVEAASRRMQGLRSNLVDIDYSLQLDLRGGGPDGPLYR